MSRSNTKCSSICRQSSDTSQKVEAETEVMSAKMCAAPQGVRNDGRAAAHKCKMMMRAVMQ